MEQLEQEQTKRMHINEQNLAGDFARRGV